MRSPVRSSRRARLRAVPASQIPNLADLHILTSREWEREQQKHDLAIFRRAAASVPAYERFLRDHAVSVHAISDAESFKTLPTIHKGNYLRKYAWGTLCSGKCLNDNHLVLAATSGSTGKPFYFPRATGIDEHASLFHRLYLENTGFDPAASTLVIVGFGMGVWIGGIITYEAFSRVSETGFPLTLITPGTNKKEIFEALRELGPHYEQVVLCAYPPFIKDLVDEGPANGITWKNLSLRILCAAESFSETFRDYLVRHAHLRDPLRSVVNIYGSAELGTMAMETPLSILVRRFAVADPALFTALFGGGTRLPTLAQFIPSCVSFEEESGALYCTADNALPLVRYDIGDRGGVMSYDELVRRFKACGVDLSAEIKKAGITATVCKLPFVYVYERADLSTKLYGAIIYPEHVKSGLQATHLEKHLTGKFTMMTEHDADQNEYLEIHLELKPSMGESQQIREAAVAEIVKSLIEKSDEYRYLSGTIRDKVIPKVVLWPHAHPEHFKTGTKQKWVKKHA